MKIFWITMLFYTTAVFQLPAFSPEMMEDLRDLANKAANSYVEMTENVENTLIDLVANEDTEAYYRDIYEGFGKNMRDDLMEKAAGMYAMIKKGDSQAIRYVDAPVNMPADPEVTIKKKFFDQNAVSNHSAFDAEKLKHRAAWTGVWSGEAEFTSPDQKTVPVHYSVSFTNEDNMRIRLLHDAETDPSVSIRIRNNDLDRIQFTEQSSGTLRAGPAYKASLNLNRKKNTLIGSFSAQDEAGNSYSGVMRLHRLPAEPVVIAVHGIGGGSRQPGWADGIKQHWGIDNFEEVTFTYQGRDALMSYIDFLPQAKHWAVSVGQQLTRIKMRHPNAPVILVAHSWGTVTTTMALNGFTWFKEDAEGAMIENRHIQPVPKRLEFDFYVTIGSPLGIFAHEGLTDNWTAVVLSELDFFFRQDKPWSTGMWVNFYDPHDPVSQYPEKLYGPAPGDNRKVYTGATEIAAHTAIWTCTAVTEYVGKIYRILGQQDPPSQFSSLAAGLEPLAAMPPEDQAPPPPEEYEYELPAYTGGLPEVPEPDHLESDMEKYGWKGILRNMIMLKKALVDSDKDDVYIHYTGMSMLSETYSSHIDIAYDPVLSNYIEKLKSHEQKAQNIIDEYKIMQAFFL